MNGPSRDMGLGSLFDLSQEHFRRLERGLAPTEESTQRVGELFARLYDVVYNAASKHLRRVQDREDCAQGVLAEVLVWLRECRFEEEVVEFVPWVCGMAHHLAINAARAAEKERPSAVPAGVAARQWETDSDPASAWEAMRDVAAKALLLKRGLRELKEVVSPRDFEILVSRRLKGRKAQMLGKMYRLSPDRVRSIERALLKKLRYLIEMDTAVTLGKKS